MIRSFRNRDTERFFEGDRIAAFQGFTDQAARRLTLLDSAESLRDLAVLRSNRLEALRAIAQVSTAFGSTANGASASVGPGKGLTMWKSRTITEGMQV